VVNLCQTHTHTHTQNSIVNVLCLLCQMVGSFYGVQILLFVCVCVCVCAEVMNFEKIFLGPMKP